MTIRTSRTALKAELDALAALLNGGTIQVRTGAQPATPQTAATGTLLATLTFSSPAFGAAADSGNNAQIVANAISDDASADADGTAGWFRALTSGAAAVFDGTVSESGGGGDAIINSDAIQVGGRVRITSLTYTLPM